MKGDLFMKKIFTSIMFLAFAAASVVAQENLLKNPTFVEWNDKYDSPASWTCYNATCTLVDGPQVDQTAVQLVPTGNDRVDLYQYVNSLSEGTAYTVSFDYKVLAAGNGFRPWFRWQNYDGQEGSWVDPLEEDMAFMQGDYLENASEWTHVSGTITAPATTNAMQYAFRGYRGNEVVIANPIMVKGTGLGISDAQAAATGIYSANGSVYVLSDGVGTVEVYNLLGQLVRTEQVVDGCNELSGLAQGQVYVVRYGEKAQKVVL